MIGHVIPPLIWTKNTRLCKNYYDLLWIRKLNCTTSAGEDALKSLKEAYDYVESIDLTFTSNCVECEWCVEDYLIHANHPFYRLSYDGCFTTTEFQGILVIVLIVMIVVLVLGARWIGKYSKSLALKRKHEKEANSLLYSYCCLFDEFGKKTKHNHKGKLLKKRLIWFIQTSTDFHLR